MQLGQYEAREIRTPNLLPSDLESDALLLGHGPNGELESVQNKVKIAKDHAKHSFSMVFAILTLCRTDSRSFHWGSGSTAAVLSPD